MFITPVNHGRVKFVINLGNPLLARADGAGIQGVSVDLARRFAGQLGVQCDLVPVNNAREAVDLLESGEADIGFLAIDPQRQQHLQFTHGYLYIEGYYLVKHDSPLQDIDDVGQAGHKVVVGRGSAYALYLSRHLQHAQVIRAESSAGVVSVFIQNHADVAADVKHQLQRELHSQPGLHLLPGHFMLIKQAMILNRQHGPAGLQVLQDFLNDCLPNGELQDSLQRHHVTGAELVSLGA
ncbi:MAG: transporter substrate-binding domain-containing protein [Limnohabitans sp.]|nr:transporter substrate-binding domain-containing protein [Limnohabitans sp.]